jgi:hypothetical protein
LAGLLGPVLGGILYGIIGLKILVIISCIAFFLSAVMEIFIDIPFIERTSDKNIISIILGDVRDGFYYIIKDNPIILKIVFLASLLNLFLSPLFIIGTPYILRVIMKSNDIMYGLGLGILQLGTIMGALSTGILAKILKISKLYIPFFIIALLLIPMALAVSPVFLRIGYWPPFTLFFTSTFLIAFILTMVNVFVITDVQKKTSNEMLGKVMAIIMTVSQIAAPLGQMLYGIIFQIAKTVVYFPVLFATVSTIIIAFGIKKLLKYDEISTE